MKKHFFLGRAIALATLATLPVIFLPTFYSFADSPGNLDDAQVRSLKAFGIPIPVPSYIPQGFTVNRITINDLGRGSRGYEIEYRDMEWGCFVVGAEVSVAVPEAPETEFKYSFPVVTNLFGRIVIGFDSRFDPDEPYDQVPSSQQLNSPQPRIMSFLQTEQQLNSQSIKGPFPENGASVSYYYVGTEGEGCGFSMNRSLTPLEMKKILQSLTWL